MPSNRSSIAAFDIDGTITTEGPDLWRVVTRNLSRDTARFDAAVARWRQDKPGDPFGASKAMMRVGLELLDLPAGVDTIREEARTVTRALIAEGRIREKAIATVEALHHEGKTIVWTTTNYQESAATFLRALMEHGSIDERVGQQVHVIGTRVNWDARFLSFLNMGSGKVKSLEAWVATRDSAAVRRPIDEWLAAAFGDEPLGNDRELLEAASKSYVVVTAKNSSSDLGAHERLEW
jgi:hypothetical protein